MAEIELKFLINQDQGRAIWAAAAEHNLLRGRPRSRTLRTLYFDTEGRALAKAGIALRLRRDGRRWLQSVKHGRGLAGGLAQAGEVEMPAPGGRIDLDLITDGDLKADILDRLDGAAVGPVGETVIARESAELAMPDGTRAELAIDSGEIRAGTRSAPHWEAEIELIEGEADGLYRIAKALFPEGGLRFSTLSKAARTARLAECGVSTAPPAPRKARTVPIHARQTVEQAARDVLRECLDQLAENMAALPAGDDPAGPHQLRIALRRLRVALTIFKPALACDERGRLAQEARWLAREVGALRDLEVARDEMVVPMRMSHPREPGFELLLGAIRTEITSMRAKLAGIVAGRRAQAFLLDTSAFVETRGWLDPQDFDQSARLALPVEELARHALDKRWKHVRAHAQHLAHLNEEERHGLRKQLKKLRYTAEFLAALYQRKAVKPFLKRLEALQDAFGVLNDAAMAKSLLARAEWLPPVEPAAHRAAGWLIGLGEARAEPAWESTKGLWRDLEEAEPFWR